jgi:transcriptional regulator with XRE-family HTH domain
VSLKAKPLQTNDLSDTLAGAMTLRVAEQVRIRLREELTRKKMSQRDLAGMLDWSQSRVAKLLTGRVEMSIGDLEALCFALGLSLTEAVRDHGMEFCAEMHPSELRILERMRQLQPAVLDAVMTLLDVKTKTRMQERHAAPLHKKARRQV